MNISPNAPVDSLSVNSRFPAKVEARTAPAADNADTASARAPAAPQAPVDVPLVKPLPTSEQPTPPSAPWPFEGQDLKEVIQHWGEPGSSYDFDGNGTVDVDDLLYMIEHWPAAAEKPAEKPAARETPLSVDVATPTVSPVDVNVATPAVRPVDADVARPASGAVDSNVETRPVMNDLGAASARTTQTTFNGNDLEELVRNWGKAHSGFDFDADGLVDVDDMLHMLQNWEPSTQAPIPPARESTRDVASSGAPADPAKNINPTTEGRTRRTPRDAQVVADRLIDRLTARGFGERPPTNIREILDNLDLDRAGRRTVMARLREQYPSGLGINVKA